MNINALSVANYLVQQSNVKGKPLHLLGLIKRVYIVHGFSLAILNKSALDERFDKVEAWKYGPVVPSVYHSFKHNENNPIKDLGFIMGINEEDDKVKFTTPMLSDDCLKNICDMVLSRYKNFTDEEIVELTHAPNSPWTFCYKKGKTEPIPDFITRVYYDRLIKIIKEKAQSK